MERPLPELTSFSEHIESLGMTPSAELVSYRTGTDVADIDGHFPDGIPLARIVRVRTVDQRPVGVHTLLLPTDLAAAAGVSAAALRLEPGLSVYRALSASGVEIDLAREKLIARRATAPERRRLMLRPGDPVLEVLRQSYDIDGRAVELVRAAYRADRYDYVTWLRRPGETGQALAPRRSTP